MSLTVQQSYDLIAKYFAETRIFTWKWTDNFINNLNINSFILDLGSGNGRNTKYKKYIIFGLDISLEQLKMNKDLNQSINADMIKLPFKNNIFEAIICIASFHHLETIEKRELCLMEMYRVLKYNGKILLSVWSINQPKKTRRNFNKYGDIIVTWKSKCQKFIIPRYYYIFEIDEIKTLLNKFFIIEKYYWDCGNEIFELIKK
jgi:ubiquinone/menaquinone biosynthesis C-methylase UbiE